MNRYPRRDFYMPGVGFLSPRELREYIDRVVNSLFERERIRYRPLLRKYPSLTAPRNRS